MHIYIYIFFFPINITLLLISTQSTTKLCVNCKNYIFLSCLFVASWQISISYRLIGHKLAGNKIVVENRQSFESIFNGNADE